jgi:putative ABC transport system permease protein
MSFIERLRTLLRRPQVEAEMEEELRHHLALEAEQHQARGLSPDAAARRARIDFGGIESVREAHRDARGMRWLEDFLADARHSIRSLRRSPVLALAAILTLALGIGANTAIFSAVNAVILRPLPFPEAEHLVMLWEENPEKGWYKNTSAPANYLDWKEQVAAFEDIAALADFDESTALTGEGETTLLTTSTVTGNYFSVLGVQPVIGRMFSPEETWATGTKVALLSEGTWRNRFGANPAIIGRSLTLDDEPVQIVGVIPDRANLFPHRRDLWRPMAWDPADRSRVFFRRAHWLQVIGRVEPGTTLAEANSQLQVTVRRLQADYPETNRTMGAGMTPLQEFLTGSTRQPLYILLGAVLLLLLIACGNVGNLLLVRAAGLEREVSLRLALGARRNRVVRQALTESLVISFVGGAVGLLLGWWGTFLLLRLQPAGMLPVQRIGMSWGVLWFIATITTLCGLLFGLAPAIWGARRVPAEALKEGAKSTGGLRVRRWSNALVISEVAIALLLTVGAGLLLRSFWQLQTVHPGFDGRGVHVTMISLPQSRYDTPDKIENFFGEVLRQARQIPGAVSVAGTTNPPLTGYLYTSDFKVAGWPDEKVGFEVAHRKVTREYFATMKVPVLQGRGFTEEDTQGSPPVVIINAAMAKSAFPGVNPIGQRLTFDKQPVPGSIWYTIIGVSGDERMVSLSDPAKLEVLEPLEQGPRRFMHVLVRTSGDPAAIGSQIRAIVGAIDPNIAIYSMETMDAIRARSLAERRFILTLLITFAGVGVVLAVVGVYGVMAQLARARVREMGIRIALGAEAGQVQWMVIRHGLRLVSIGLALGVAAALIATRALTSMLYEVTAADPATYLLVAVLLVTTAILACWLPAVRASRASPVAVLRAE